MVRVGPSPLPPRWPTAPLPASGPPADRHCSATARTRHGGKRRAPPWSPPTTAERLPAKGVRDGHTAADVHTAGGRAGAGGGRGKGGVGDPAGGTHGGAERRRQRRGTAGEVRTDARPRSRRRRRAGGWRAMQRRTCRAREEVAPVGAAGSPQRASALRPPLGRRVGPARRPSVWRLRRPRLGAPASPSPARADRPRPLPSTPTPADAAHRWRRAPSPAAHAWAPVVGRRVRRGGRCCAATAPPSAAPTAPVGRRRRRPRRRGARRPVWATRGGTGGGGGGRAGRAAGLGVARTGRPQACEKSRRALSGGRTERGGRLPLRRIETLARFIRAAGRAEAVSAAAKSKPVASGVT